MRAISRVQIRRGLLASIPVLKAGELYFTTDTYELYAGDGTTNRLLGCGSAGALKIDQSTPQTVINGNPEFEDGLDINNVKVYMSSNHLFIETIDKNFYGLRVGDNIDNITIYQGGIDRNGTGNLNFTNNEKIRFGSGVPVKKYFEVNTNGSVSLNNGAYTIAGTDGTAGQVLKTNGAGSVSFGDAVTGASGSFTTVDSKTVTVVNGIITSIV